MTAKKQAAKTTAASEYKDFEAALKALHAGKYKDARKTFEKAHKARDNTGRMGAVLTSYISLCDRFLAKEPDPKGAATDELYDSGIYLHNAGRHEEALKYFEKALASSKGGGDHIRYAMAATETLLNNADRALEHLKSAIEIRPENRFLANGDPDFQSLASNQKFKDLVTSG